jgi:6,7-dimethyl-8-ribityllumazine synthase
MSTAGYRFDGRLEGAGLRIGVVCSRFNTSTVEALLAGARRGLKRHGVRSRDVHVVWVPGAFEIPVVAKQMAESGRFDAVVTLGAVIRGDTPHFEYVCGPCADGVMRAQLDTGVPVMFGVLTVNTFEQARQRSGTGVDNKGDEAAVGAIEMALLLRGLTRGSSAGR